MISVRGDKLTRNHIMYSKLFIFDWQGVGGTSAKGNDCAVSIIRGLKRGDVVCCASVAAPSEESLPSRPGYVGCMRFWLEFAW